MTQTPAYGRRPFVKMHGLGNDFIIFDTREEEMVLSADAVRALANRHTGIGCDQLILVGPAGRANAFMQIFNPDGSEAGACGNATRCVAHLLMTEAGTTHCSVQTIAGMLSAERAGDAIAVNMGAPALDWQAIPVKEPLDTEAAEFEVGPLSRPGLVNMGNPHAVFFVDDVTAIDLADVGPLIERHEVFPEGTNVSVAQVVSRNLIILRVWERGAGLTQACGSAACAALVAASRRGLCDRRASVHLPGGAMMIEWTPDNHVVMTGPTAISFDGEVDIDQLLGAGTAQPRSQVL